MKTSFLSSVLLSALVLSAPLPRLQADPADRSVYQMNGHWTGDDGASMALADLRGHPVVLAMIFTRCGYACPLTVRQMRTLQSTLPAALRSRTRLVLVSFDTEADTPAVLNAYRRQFGLDAGTWRLLHGDADSVRDLAMVLGVNYVQEGPGQFVHSSLVTVLDANGEIVWQRASLDGAMAEAAAALAGAHP